MGEVLLKNVVKRYGKVEAVKGISFDVQEQECVAILGPSGAGKTSTLKMVAGLEDVSSGEIWIDGRIANFLEPHERDVAMTFESYALYPHMSVFDNMALPMRSKVHRRPEAEIKQRVQQVGDMLGIGMLLDRMPGQLSQGQKQRVGLGRTLVREPSVFLFDEPLSHVDAKVRHRMRMELKRIQEALRTTSLYVTHDYLEALALGDRIVVLREGEIQQVGTPKDIFHRPVNEFVAQIVGDPRTNLIDATVASRDGEMVFELQGAGCDLPVFGELRQKLVDWPGKHVRIGVRPMYITAYLAEQPVCQLNGSVYVFERIETKGVLTTKVGEVMILAETDPDFTSKPNQPVWLSVDLSKVRVYDPETGDAIAP